MTRYSSITTVISQVPETIEEWVQKEIEEGILDDVKSFITSYENEFNLETPTVWMNVHEWEAYEEKALSNIYRVKIPVEFACIEYDEDIKECEKLAMNLTGRVVASILKHYRRYKKNQDLFKMLKINFKTLYPNGTIGVEGKQDKVAISGVLLEFIVEVEWFKCIITENQEKKKINLEEEIKLKEILKR